MDIHYNAFISYRHHPVDIKVAEQIHRGLEHYRVPKALKKSKDTKLRLFRDKEELPITSNLSDDITRALKNSDFLIVICSTHTKESLWVQREIETFLQTHDHSRVLTVLVDGEPYETIPQILCSAERVDPVTGEKQLIPIEPLSCDWRGSRRKARREELPRLAAALLGCGYDELRQRERQYRTRRMAAVLSVALAATLAFTSYVVYNSMQLQKANLQLEQANIEIQHNLEEAQINQSRYLASASAQQLEAGDRMLAMALAMEALPAQEGERPYVAQAELALSEAVGAYVSEEEIAAVGSISCDALINFFEATDSRDRMFVFDQRYVLSVWDLNTYQKLASVQLESNASKMLVTAQDELILYCGFTVKCFDKDLKQLWQTDGCNAVALSDRRDVLLAEKDDNTVVFLDTATGQEVRDAVQIPTQAADGSTDWRIGFRQEMYDLTQPLVLEYSKFGRPLQLVSVDPHSGAITVFGDIPESFEIRCTGKTEDGNVLVMAAGEEGIWNGLFGLMMTHSQVPVRVWCYTPQGDELWTAELTTYSYTSERTLYAIHGSGQIFCQVDNLLAVLDAQTGEVLSTCETGATPIWVMPDETYAIALLEDGSAGTFHYDGNDFNSTRYFKESLASGFGGKGFFIRQSYSSQILVYGHIRDENWQAFDGDSDGVFESFAASGDYLAVKNNDELLLFDVRQKTLLWRLPEESGIDFRLLDFTDDAQKLWLCQGGKEIICVDTRTGTWETYELPRQHSDEDMYYSRYYRSVMNDGVIYVQAKGLHSNSYYVVAFDTATLQSAVVEVCMPEDTSYNTGTEILTARDGRAYFWEDTEKKLYEADIRTGQVQNVLQELSSKPMLQFLHDGNTCMVAADSTVTFYEGEAILFAAQLEDLKGVSAYRTEQEIILLVDSGDFIRFDLTGQKLGEIGGHQYTGFYSSLNYKFGQEKIIWNETGDGDLFVNIFNSGNLIDMDCWECRAWVPNCITYLPSFDRFVTKGEDPATYASLLGLYERYTLEQIKDMAREALGQFALTQEQKAQYGIS